MIPVRSPVMPGCIEDSTGWRRTTSFTGRSTHQHAVIDEHLAPFAASSWATPSLAIRGSKSAVRGGLCMRAATCTPRREFVEAEASEPILSAQAESLYRQLYDVEERGKTRDAQGLLELRQREAVQIWQRFDQWLESEPVRRVLPQSPLGKAVTYMRNQWTALQRYLSDSRIPIDNSQSEQDLRPLTVGRTNWKFLGHPQAAAGRLQLVSIVSSAARHHLVVHDYLEDVLRKLADAAQHHPAQRGAWLGVPARPAAGSLGSRAPAINSARADRQSSNRSPRTNALAVPANESWSAAVTRPSADTTR